MKNASPLAANVDAKGEYVMCDLDDIALEADSVARATPVATAIPVDDYPDMFDERKIAAVAPDANKIDPEDGSEDSSEPTDLVSWNSRSYAAGVLCCVLSSCCMGPVLGCLLGCGTAYAAAKSPNGTAVGDTARAIGDVALTAKAKAIEVDEKHAIAARTKKAASGAAVSTRHAATGAWESIKDAEKRQRISERSVAVLRDTGRRVQQFDRDYRVTERTADGISRSFAYMSQKIKESYGSNGESRRGTETSAPSSTTEEDAGARNAAPLVSGGDGTFA